ncbi:hypothetical protein FQN57_003063 [Myotisia sp. PD_48]|nr:hypothetical protein FQN57_003063 [Myotisia sp. PD_48]
MLALIPFRRHFTLIFVCFLCLLILNVGILHRGGLLIFRPAPQRDVVSDLVSNAELVWREYNHAQSTTFSEAVATYRRRYGRHPPPGYKEWYLSARSKKVQNIDDFDQIMDDLRPFWAVEPKSIRQLAANMCYNAKDNGISAIHIRNNTVANITFPSWRIDSMSSLVQRVTKYLPDMDIVMNRLDQPRVLVSWENMQGMLQTEAKSRNNSSSNTTNSFTPGMNGFMDFSLTKYENIGESVTWSGIPSKQYMDVATGACPPESPARDESISTKDANALYKTEIGGLVHNFNKSTDLCTVGPVLKNLHGFLFSASSISISRSLIPIFSECKVSVNNDILFPANVYWNKDKRYTYDPSEDSEWSLKTTNLFWRGATSGGISLKDTWHRLHRQRFEIMSNGTKLGDRKVNIITQPLVRQHNRRLDNDLHSNNYPDFKPAEFAKKYFDFAFTDAMSCIPNCSFYDDVFTYKDKVPLSHQFQSKYLVDIDGQSFSGRWRAFLFSKSLGIKATIFREWHDSRLFAWKHFVPLDNRYDDLYAIMTYFIGTNKTDGNNAVYIPSHDSVAKKIATQGRDWAQKALREEDMEIYMHRLLLEYARIIDDNRDSIGYSGDGGEVRE